MQILIDISEGHYKTLQRMRDVGLGYYNKAILNGKVLPKGHGDLIERSCLHDFRKYLNTCPQGCNEDDETWFTSSEIDNRIEQYPTIIEADRGE